ncbi:DUF6290 family protein [Gluconobacter cerinus]|uniref:DUF6290 family protein n=1 Tax=Gluconobacter cerinus TaxID=38307 RepID=UPI001B8BE340|nr:DUF6290 family protein [Gluconobacter cerinus]MBS0984138.1 plasmid mobilization relaxosome protein MobC [Gluconobacter cerinus]
MMEKMIHIRVSDKEHKRIHKYAKNKKIKVSKFARDTLLNEQAGGSLISDELLLLRRELSAIGNNLNQIAKRSNSGEQIQISDTLEAIADMQNNINKNLRIFR